RPLAPVELGDPDDAVERDPGHHLRMREVSRLATDLPDALVGQAPAVDHGAGDPSEELPEDGVDLAAVLPVDPDRVEQLAEDVELERGGGAVADSYRQRAQGALWPVELDLGQQPLP